MHQAKDKLQGRGQIIRRHSFLFILPLFLALACLLAACGSNGGTGSTPPPASTPTRSTTNGCPHSSVTNPSPVKPDVVIAMSNSNSTVTAHKGDLIEVRLPSNEQWSGPITSQGLLALQTPSGYLLRSDKMCVWHFVAQGTGTTRLTFSGRAICNPGKLCPMYVVKIPFTVEVK